MFNIPPLKSNYARIKMRKDYLKHENDCVAQCYEQSTLTPQQQAFSDAYAYELVKEVRGDKASLNGVQGLMQEYSLSDNEGIVLMCLAEALLRIPDSITADKLIEDKLGGGDFSSHIGKGHTWFVNASTWGLVVTGKILNINEDGWANILSNLTKKTGTPIIRTAINQMMKILGREFVLGETISEAISRATKNETKGYRHSYDMLGEGAKTMEDASHYYNMYEMALHTIGKSAMDKNVINSAGISIKISALHPRYEFIQYDRVMAEVVPKMIALCKHAKSYNIGLFIDAEEMDRLDISLDIIDILLSHEDLDGWEGLGIVIQAYSKRAIHAIDALYTSASDNNRKIMVRLVKGAYWDAEIKRAQEKGLSQYPVFTRKEYTDISYTACSKKLFKYADTIYACFATHNAQTVASIVAIFGDTPFEFQKLHGMGDPLYAMVTKEKKIPCRVYAPVGNYRDLLPYLVRRLLENGANSSFVNRIHDETIPIEDIIKDPRNIAKEYNFDRHDKICLPTHITMPQRTFAKGIDMTDINEITILKSEMEKHNIQYEAFAIIDGKDVKGDKVAITSPQDKNKTVGIAHFVNSDTVKKALEVAHNAQPEWDKTPADDRAKILEKCADMLEQEMPKFMAIATLEAGKTLEDGIAEIREAVDFLRYYANDARRLFSKPTILPGVTGETNTYQLHGRGVFLCISPWNFPLAIFLGQIAGALSAGNTVVAKPAESTPIIAYEAIRLMIKAGLPSNVVSLIPGQGSLVGSVLVPDNKIAGVAFTGSSETARVINRMLAERLDGIIPFIAETGGQNAMLVDSSALLEQVTRDVVNGAFQSAGQRCSATRVLFLQDDIADDGIKMIKGAMAELNIGDPEKINTDVGPVIDEKSLNNLNAHKQKMMKEAILLGQVEIPENIKDKGNFFAPCMFEISDISVLEREIFGPCLHIVRWKNTDLDAVIDSINNTGYGLTFAIHSRIEETVTHVLNRIKVGNAYVNRNQIGALVGIQPFGGEGKSGTGFKAGGPNYLLRFAGEKTVSIDTTAAGGNASLMAEV